MRAYKLYDIWTSKEYFFIHKSEAKGKAFKIINSDTFEIGEFKEESFKERFEITSITIKE